MHESYITSVAVNALCEGAGVTGNCRGAFPRYFFNEKTGKCQKFTYGGCGGTPNNHKTIEACNAACMVQHQNDIV